MSERNSIDDQKINDRLTASLSWEPQEPLPNVGIVVNVDDSFMGYLTSGPSSNWDSCWL